MSIPDKEQLQTLPDENSCTQLQTPVLDVLSRNVLNSTRQPFKDLTNETSQGDVHPLYNADLFTQGADRKRKGKHVMQPSYIPAKTNANPSFMTDARNAARRVHNSTNVNEFCIGRRNDNSPVGHSNGDHSHQIPMQPTSIHSCPTNNASVSSVCIQVPTPISRQKFRRILPRPDSTVNTVTAHMEAKVASKIARQKRKTAMSSSILRNTADKFELAGYENFGDPDETCLHCGAQHWLLESTIRSRNKVNPDFSSCCRGGKVQLPFPIEPPKLLKDLFDETDPRSSTFFKHIRAINSAFAFTSMGGKVDYSVNKGSGPYSYRIVGENFHRVGSLLPLDGEPPKFAQLYVHDTQNEISNRLNSISEKLQEDMVLKSIMSDIKDMLDEHNILCKTMRMARDACMTQCATSVKLNLLGKRSKDGRLYNLPTASELAVLIVGDMGNEKGDRDLIIEHKDGRLQRINELHPQFLPMQYPLLFPYGEDGFRLGIHYRDSANRGVRTEVTMREFFCYHLFDRDGQYSSLHKSKRLKFQFFTDGFTVLEGDRLRYLKFHQDKLRVDKYDSLKKSLQQGTTDAAQTGQRIILPSTFTGGPRYMQQNYQDAMAICRFYGYPDLFITFTCNPKWPEIQTAAKRRKRSPQDEPRDICIVFKLKLDALVKKFEQGQFFGQLSGVVYTVEFQKRGLPHAHILLFLQKAYKYKNLDEIDRIISAEIPDCTMNKKLHENVKEYMMHGPCGAMDYNAPCMQGKNCTKYFPKEFAATSCIDKDGYTLYKRRDNGRVVKKKQHDLDNRYVVPYNPEVLLWCGGHCNVEYCNQDRSMKYLFQYITKGSDRITAKITTEDQDVDEIKQFFDCRYVSMVEAIWRTLGYPINYRSPSVERLSFHLPNEQQCMYEDDDDLEEVVDQNKNQKSKFVAWMDANAKYPEAHELMYVQFPTKYVWRFPADINEPKVKAWFPRSRGMSIGRLIYIPPTAGELHYLRLLLNFVKGPTSYEEIRTVDGIVHKSFRDACCSRGLLDDDSQYIDGIEEASRWASGNYLRNVFANLLASRTMSRPDHVWNEVCHLLYEDLLHRQRRNLNMPDMQLSEEQLKHLCLKEIEALLNTNCKTLRDFPEIELPDLDIIANVGNRHIQSEMGYDRVHLQDEVRKMLPNLTEEQNSIFREITSAVEGNKGGMFFVYGYGGTGKTFLWTILSSYLRVKGNIVLCVASSGLASLLIPGGRTAHSRFGIPLKITETSTCTISHGSSLAGLIQKAKLIIWDEAPMIHKHCFEALDRTLRDVLSASNPNSRNEIFGGKVVVLGGDFRQILPVIAYGTRSDVVSATVNSSYIWQSCKVLQLTKNMRLQKIGCPVNAAEVEEFAEWLLRIGEGRPASEVDTDETVKFPDEMVITYKDDPIKAIVNELYPDFVHRMKDVTYMQSRAILGPTHDIVDSVNDYMTALMPGAETTYFSSDSVCKSDESTQESETIYTPEFLNSIKCGGLPNHEIKLKVGIPIMLLRNIDHAAGLCNGTRMTVDRLGKHVIQATVITGKSIGTKVIIPRMILSPSDAKIPFKFSRRQLPISVCFAMTINKSQGQTLDQVGIFLPRQVFTHGQLYVAVSRVRSKSGLKVLISDDNGNSSNIAHNVVYHEVFNNITSA